MPGASIEALSDSLKHKTYVIYHDVGLMGEAISAEQCHPQKGRRTFTRGKTVRPRRDFGDTNPVKRPIQSLIGEYCPTFIISPRLMMIEVV
jgi:hypothetical protein